MNISQERPQRTCKGENLSEAEEEARADDASKLANYLAYIYTEARKRPTAILFREWSASKLERP